MTDYLMKELLRGLKVYYSQANETEKVILNYTLARAALANISANLGGALIAMLADMFVPGASSLISAVLSFIDVYLSGILFLQLILKMAKKSNDPYTFSDVTKDEAQAAVRGVKLSTDDLQAARAAHDKNKN